MAIFGQFTKCAQQVLMTAQQFATREGQPYVGTLHFLYGLLDVGEAPESVTRHIQKEDVKQVLDQIDDEVSLHPGHGPVQMTPRARRVLDGMTGRNARWYYLSSLANQGLGNSIDALQDARRAALRKKHAPLNFSVPLPDAKELPQPGPDPEEQAIASEQYAATIERMQTCLLYNYKAADEMPCDTPHRWRTRS